MRRILILSLCFLTMVGCGCKNTKNKESEENLPFDVNFDISKETTVEGLEISNIQVVVDKNGISNYTATVTNTTETTYKLSQINMLIKNKEGKEVISLVGYIGTNMNPGESRKLSVNTDKNLMDGYEVEYTIIK